MSSLELILSEETVRKIEDYQKQLITNPRVAGYRLAKLMDVFESDKILDVDDLTRLLLKTKKPQIFAESDVIGDGSDWNMVELSILGDICASLPVEVFDNAAHEYPVVFENSIQGHLYFVPGALLRSNGDTPCDFDEIVRNDELDDNFYFKLYERRLLPVLLHANNMCKQSRRRGFITIPGIGCGQFAGRFSGRLGQRLNETIKRLLVENYSSLDSIDAVYYDPYNECATERVNYGDITYFVRPLTQGNNTKSQLCPPAQLQDEGDNYADCLLISIVAWDHVSWPGNDFYIGARVTDDGVKAAATDTMYKITGVKGAYCSRSFHYQPPSEFATWEELVIKRELHFGQSAPIWTP